MDFDIFLAPAADSWKVVKRAEALGFHRAWFYDTQLLNAEVFVSMAAAAIQTSRIRLGTGVLIPSNRIAPVAASGLASLNALAPGRIDFGVSTGFTARRTMGLRPVKLADMEAAWRDAGGDPAAMTATAAIAGCVLGEGEPGDSPRARAHAGPTATIALHSLVERDEFGDLGRPIPPQLAPLIERYRQIYLKYEPADARYLSNHRGHLMFLRPEEQAICTAELIRTTTFTAPRSELRERIRELGRVGFDHVGLTIRHGYPEMLEEW